MINMRIQRVKDQIAQASGMKLDDLKVTECGEVCEWDVLKHIQKYNTYTFNKAIDIG